MKSWYTLTKLLIEKFDIDTYQKEIAPLLHQILKEHEHELKTLVDENTEFVKKIIDSS